MPWYHQQLKETISSPTLGAVELHRLRSRRLRRRGQFSLQSPFWIVYVTGKEKAYGAPTQQDAHQIIRRLEQVELAARHEQQRKYQPAPVPVPVERVAA